MLYPKDKRPTWGCKENTYVLKNQTRTVMTNYFAIHNNNTVLFITLNAQDQNQREDQHNMVSTNVCMLQYDWWIDWLVFNANLSNISALSWRAAPIGDRYNIMRVLNRSKI
jgi:hypothetical protein